MKHERIFLDTEQEVWIDTYVADSECPRDAILVIPGGGYGSVCTDREGEPIALSFFAKGLNAFVLNYRVIGNTKAGKEGKTVTYPAQLTDAGRAMIYIKEHADELSVNRDRVFAVGFSAGGHLCGSLATMFEYPEILDYFGEKAIEIRPTGAVLAYPVVKAFEKAHFGSFVNLLGKPYSEITEEEKIRFSLDSAANEKSSPMFIWHTVEDTLVPVENSLQLGIALQNKGVPYMMELYPYGPHGLALSNEITEYGNPDYVQPMAECWIERACEWFKTL